MATLPDVDGMQRRLPGNTRGASSAPALSPIDTGGSLLAQTMAAAGADLLEIDNRRQQRADRINSAKAQSSLTTELFNAFRDTDDSDYATQVKRFSERAQKHMDQAAKGLSSAEARELFTADGAARVAEWSARVHQRALTLERQTHVADLQTDLDTMFGQAAAAPDEAAAMDIISNANERIAVLVDTGALTAPEGAAKFKEFKGNYAEARLRSMNPSERWEALSSPTEGLASYLSARQLISLRESTRDEADLDVAYRIVDAANGAQLSTAQLKALPANRRRIVEELQRARKAERRADEAYWRDAQERARKDKAYRTSADLVAANDTFDAQIKALNAMTDIDPKERALVRDELTRRYQEYKVAEESRIEDNFFTLRDLVLGDRKNGIEPMPLSEVIQKNPTEWEGMSNGYRDVLNKLEGIVNGTSKLSEAEQTRNFVNYIDRLNSPDAKVRAEAMNEDPATLEAQMSPRHFIMAANARGDLSSKEYAARVKNTIDASSQLLVDPPLYNSVRDFMFLQMGLEKDDEDERTAAVTRLDALIVARQNQKREASGGASNGQLTFQELQEVANFAGSSVEVKREWYVPDDIKAAANMTAEDWKKVDVPGGIRKQILESMKKNAPDAMRNATQEEIETTIRERYKSMVLSGKAVFVEGEPVE